MSDPSQAAASADALAARGEFSLIGAIARRLPQHEAVLVPPGDDAAVVRVEGVDMVVTTDVLVQGVHFRTDWCSAEDVGHRAAAASLADLAAMGATPSCLVVAVTAPGATDAAWLLRLADGLRDEAAAVAASVVGGDISSGGQISVAVTALGSMEGRTPVRRGGALPGDDVAVAGRLGWAEAGLAVLSKGFRSPRALVDAYRRPEIDYSAGRAAALAGAHAMCDVSDGLLADLGHIARASGVGIDVDSTRLEIGDPVASVASAYGVDPLAWVLGGGHDHALVATFAAGAPLPDGFMRIGTVVDGVAGVREAGEGAHEERALDGWGAVTVDGVPWTGAGGHEHFRRP